MGRPQRDGRVGVTAKGSVVSFGECSKVIVVMALNIKKNNELYTLNM